MNLLEGKKAIITGGSRGIGEAMVRTYVAQGADVVFTYRSSAQQANELAETLSGESGQNVYAIQSDAADFVQAEQLIKDSIERLGSIDVLINNAGITRDNLMLRMSEEQWDEVINVNLKSVFNLTKNVMRTMLKQRSGSIINISSVVGIEGNGGQANYSASKAGIIGFSKSIAKEVGSRGIRCNALAPGFIETDMTEQLDDKTRDYFLNDIPLKRFGKPEEVAQVCAFLGSDMSSYVTGQLISVCGALHT